MAHESSNVLLIWGYLSLYWQCKLVKFSMHGKNKFTICGFQVQNVIFSYWSFLQEVMFVLFFKFFKSLFMFFRSQKCVLVNICLVFFLSKSFILVLIMLIWVFPILEGLFQVYIYDPDHI
jgi:hypothetical protein